MSYNKRNKKRKSRSKKKVMFLISEILVLGILSMVAFAVLKYGKFQIVSFKDGDIKINAKVKKEGYTTVALFGGDSRDGELGKGTHADTIIIASLNNKSGDIKMASVYRDTLTEQMDGKLKKANNAYFAGGPKDAINLLNKNFDLAIEDYVTVDFAALANIVDILGGIDVNLSDEEADEMNIFISETAKAAGKKASYIEQGGLQHLNGVQAVTYARIRKLEGGDYKRTQRQRLVIEKVFAKLKSTDLKTLNKIVDAVFPQVSTSFTLPDLIGLAPGITKYNLGETTGFPIELTDGVYDGVGSIVVPLGLTENVQELHKFLYPDKSYETTDTVEKISRRIEEFTGKSRKDVEPGQD